MESEKIINNFPDALKEPILRKIQFSIISRLDGLVDEIYNQFKHEFFPGEVAIAKVNDQRINVTVREKAKFNAIALPSGEVRPAYCKCRVEHNSTGEESFIDESQLTRDRKYFTKIILRTFIKYSVHRDSWAGAPWLVKDEYAQKYRIDQNIPLHLQKHKGQPSPNELKQLRLEKREQQKQHKLRIKQEKAREAKRVKEETKLVQKEQHLLLQRQKQLIKQEQLLEAQKIKVKHQKELEQIKIQQKQLQEHQKQLSKQNTQLQELTLSTADDGTRLIQLQQLQQELSLQNKQFDNLGIDSTASQDQSNSFNSSLNQQELVDRLSRVGTSTPKKRGRIANSQSGANSGTATPMMEEASPGVPITEKNPVVKDDLLFPYDHSKASLRPQLKKCGGIDPPHLINPILETWLFLNIYGEPLLLDTFTFDDYVDVLHFDDTETECPLLNEIHCALLCAFVGTKDTELLVQFPEPPEDPKSHADYSDDEEEEEDDEVKEEPKDKETNGDEENQTNGTKGEEDKSESEEEKEPTPEPETNKSELYAVFKNVDWKERLRRRLFKDGGWQQIIVGLLHSLLYVPEWKESITSILDTLAPLNESVALYTTYRAYMESLSFEHRVKIITILCELLHSSQLVRGYIEKCMDESTRIRRERLENLREYKALLDTIKGLEEQKKPFFPNGIPKLATPEPEELIPTSAGTTAVIPSAPSTPPIVLNGAGNKRGAATSLARQQRKKRKDDAESQLAKTNAAFRKIHTACENAHTKAGELLDSNRKGEQELVKLDCQRAKMLGKDRYHNRYWWLEGNGMRKHNPESSKEKSAGNSEKEDEEDDPDLGFLMGRLWVQGPTDEEAQAYLNIEPPRQYPAISKDEQGKFMIVASADTNGCRILVDNSGAIMSELSLAERKCLEEGDMCLTSCDEWGYYDDPEEIEALLKWLNSFGKRELRLGIEIMNIKNQIIDSMRARKEDLSRDAKLQGEELQTLRDENSNLTELEKADTKDLALLKMLTEEQELAKADKNSEDDGEGDIEMLDYSEDHDDKTSSGGDDEQPVRAGQRRRRSTRLSAVSTTPEPNGRRTSRRGAKVIPDHDEEASGETGTNGSSEAKKTRGITGDDDETEDIEETSHKRKKQKLSSSASSTKLKRQAAADQRKRANKIVEIQKRVEERVKEREELEEDMKYQVKLSRVLSWENGLAKDKVGHSLYESQRKRGNPRNSHNGKK